VSIVTGTRVKDDTRLKKEIAYFFREGWRFTNPVGQVYSLPRKKVARLHLFVPPVGTF
jgi:hypothetical protein